jgi:hypothetical protein
MSLSLPRRLARTVLLVGAAATAPLLAAGAAHAAQAAAPAGPGLGGLTALDGDGLGDAVENASHQTTVLAANAGTDAMKTILPTADQVLSTAGHDALPDVRDAAGGATDSAGRLLGGAAESATADLPATQALPTTSLVPNLGALPPLPAADQLPLSGLV